MGKSKFGKNAVEKKSGLTNELNKDAREKPEVNGEKNQQKRGKWGEELQQAHRMKKGKGQTAKN